MEQIPKYKRELTYILFKEFMYKPEYVVRYVTHNGFFKPTNRIVRFHFQNSAITFAAMNSGTVVFRGKTIYKGAING